MSNGLYKKLRMIPVVLIIISVFIIGVNLVRESRQNFVNNNEADVDASNVINNREIFGYVIELNSASYIELCRLPGVDIRMAERIIEYRIDAGGFTDIRELLLIDGISESLFEKMIPHLIIDNTK